jgi:hypothetical protein
MEKVKDKIFVLSVLTIILFSVVNTYAFNCGKDGVKLAVEGMNKHQILKDCGPPFSKETIGFDKKGGKYRIVEEWVYIINEYGHKQMYLLKIDVNGIVDEIEWLGEQN